MFQAIGYFVTLFATTIMTVVTAVIGSDTLPRALVTMADTERAFAKLGYDTNYRDAFIQYFADEAIDFNPEPGPALDRLRQQPRPPSDLRLVWEPRVGDIAMSGDLGYLTGPTETRRSDTVTRHGNYFSVWKKQADGRYKVILDVGAGASEKSEFAEGFMRAAAVATYHGTDTKAAAESSLLTADQAFSAALASRGAAAAYGETLHGSARVHRSGSPSMTTRDAAVGWMRERVTAMTSVPIKSETAQSRDLGYTWGSWAATMSGSKTDKGFYVRVWTRAADGKWWIAADVTQELR